MNTLKSASWHLSPARNFWGNIAPSDHVVQVYENENVLLDTLAGFVGGGINEGDTIIVVATRQHREELEERLRSFGIHIDTLISGERYIPLDARETLQKFMINGRPDKENFLRLIGTVIGNAQKKKRKIRAFGEMVALLWEDGNRSAAIELEQFWNEFLSNNQLRLFCAYPKALFGDDPLAGTMAVCSCHSKMISGTVSSMEQVYYKDVLAS